MAGEETSPKAPGGKGHMMPIVIVAVLMGVEGVGVFLLAKALSFEPSAALAAGTGSSEDGTTDADREEFAEIELAECRPSNIMSGKLITFHIRVSALVLTEDRERAEKLVRAKQARLEDSVNTVIRSAEPNHFSEPKLETIKRRLKHQCDIVFGDDQLIKEVLIPQMLQSGRGV